MINFSSSSHCASCTYHLAPSSVRTHETREFTAQHSWTTHQSKKAQTAKNQLTQGGKKRNLTQLTWLSAGVLWGWSDAGGADCEGTSQWEERKGGACNEFQTTWPQTAVLNNVLHSSFLMTVYFYFICCLIQDVYGGGGLAAYNVLSSSYGWGLDWCPPFIVVPTLENIGWSNETETNKFKQMYHGISKTKLTIMLTLAFTDG